MTINHGNTGPRYESIARELKTRIDAGHYAESGFLPQERELAGEFQVSRNTMRNALNILADENLITKVQGRGTIINRSREEAGEYAVLSFNTSNMSPFVVAMLHEIDRQAVGNSGFVLYIQLQNASAEELDGLRERLKLRRNLKGIILLGSYTRQDLRRLSECLSYPLVLLGDVWHEAERGDEFHVSQVVGNDYRKMHQATTYLLKQGRRRILAIGQPRNLIWGNAFYRGYEDAFIDFGVEFIPEYYCEALDNSQSPRDEFSGYVGGILQDFFSRPVRPDALIFPSELFSTVQYVAARNNLSIPGDLTVVGRSIESIRRTFPCVATDPAEIIGEVFDLLKYEREHGGRIKQRRLVGVTWLDPVPDGA